ncbi:hypothetical protein MMC26_002292 [Xylographa opegraphella]|nr:hypothetical protein [Xylographa opegraphella]
MKRAAIGHNVASNDKPKGLTRTALDGSIEHFFERENKWVPAVTHEEIREELIKEYDQKGTYGNDPATWPQVLRQIQPTLRYVKGEVKLWYRHGKIVLDPDERPIRLLEIPAVCSSKMEDWLMSAIYLSDPKVEILDIRVRMPRTVTVLEKGNQVERPLYLPNALSMRMTRFRTKYGLMPREKREGSTPKEEKLKSLLGAERVKNNDVGDFKPLTRQEITEVEAVNKGRFGHRARPENKFGKRKQNPTDNETVQVKKTRSSKSKLSTSEVLNSNGSTSGKAFVDAEPHFRRGLSQGFKLWAIGDQPFVPGIHRHDPEATYPPYQPEGLKALGSRWEHRGPGTGQNESLNTRDNTLAGPSRLNKAHQKTGFGQENGLLGFDEIPRDAWNRRFWFADTYSGFEDFHGFEGRENNNDDVVPSNGVGSRHYPEYWLSNQSPPKESSCGDKYDGDSGLVGPKVFDFPDSPGKGSVRFDPLADAVGDFSRTQDIKGHAINGIIKSHTSHGFDHTQKRGYRGPQFPEHRYGDVAAPRSILHLASNGTVEPNDDSQGLHSFEKSAVEHVSEIKDRSAGDSGTPELTIFGSAYAAACSTQEKDNFDRAWARGEDPSNTLLSDYDVRNSGLGDDEAGSMGSMDSMEELLSTAKWDPEAWSGYL